MWKKYRIPFVAELFDQLSGVKYFFTKLNLRLGYYQVKIAKRDEEKTICVTCYGTFEFLVMPFGLTSAPMTFYTLMNQVIHDSLDKFFIVYLDEIVIFSSTFKEHVKHIQLMFQRFCGN